MLSHEMIAGEDRSSVNCVKFSVRKRNEIHFKGAYAILLIMQKTNWDRIIHLKFSGLSHEVGVGKFWVGKRSAIMGFHLSSGEATA